MEWELDGEEHLAEDRGAIIVSNHQSTLDILGLNMASLIFLRILKL